RNATHGLDGAEALAEIVHRQPEHRRRRRLRRRFGRKRAHGARCRCRGQAGGNVVVAAHRPLIQRWVSNTAATETPFVQLARRDRPRKGCPVCISRTPSVMLTATCCITL